MLFVVLNPNRNSLKMRMTVGRDINNDCSVKFNKLDEHREFIAELEVHVMSIVLVTFSVSP